MIDSFIKAIDEQLQGFTNKIPFKIIGSTALFLQYDYTRITKDTDIIEVDELTEKAKAQILQIAGKNSDLCKRHHLYIDIVHAALPFLPMKPIFHTHQRFNRELDIINVEVLDVIDVIISKIKRFNAGDRNDIAAMAKLEVIDPIKLESRFKQAAGNWSFEARGEDLPKIIKNLHNVQRDFLLVEESKIELPSWIEAEN